MEGAEFHQQAYNCWECIERSNNPIYDVDSACIPFEGVQSACSAILRMFSVRPIKYQILFR